MKKIISIMLTIFMFFCYTVGSASEYRISPFNELVDLSVIPAEYADIDLSHTVKRNEALEVLLIIAEEDVNIIERIVQEHKNQSIKGWKYIDVLDNTKECAIVTESTNIGLMQGGKTENDGERMARIDDEITWEELLHLSLRVLSAGYGSPYERVNNELLVYKDLYPDRVPILMLSEDIGLINQSNITYTSAIWLNSDDLSKTVTWREFAEIVHRMLYIPTDIEGYGGTWAKYKIDIFR